MVRPVLSPAERDLKRLTEVNGSAVSAVVADVADHETRLVSAEGSISNHSTRLGTVEALAAVNATVNTNQTTSISSLNGRMNAVELKPGVLNCTSTTRPSHTGGQLIYEIDTDDVRMSNGVSWVWVANLAEPREWTAWSPTFTGITAGNGTVSARYRIDGRTLYWHYQIVLGSTSAVGTNPKLSTPSGWKVYNAGNTVQTYALGKAFAYDSSAGTFLEGGCYGSDSTDDVLTTRIIFGSTTVNAAAPFTWASGDILVVSGTCEVEPA